MISEQRFSEIIELAYRELLLIEKKIFPISFNNFTDENGNNIIICSFQEYAKITGITVEMLTLNGKFSDGFAIKNLRPGLPLILYNSDFCYKRQKHTIIHEVGHFRCMHTEHNDISEIEAHFFASQFIMPDIILRTIENRGYKLDSYFLMKHFDVSKYSANKKIAHIKNFEKSKFVNPFLEKRLLKLFSSHIDSNFPYRAKRQTSYKCNIISI